VKTSNQAIKAVTEGAEISLRTGVHLMDPLLFVMGVIAALNRGELKEANEYLARAEKAVGNNRRADSFPFIFLSVWYNLCSGNLQKAAALAKNTSILAEKIGSPIYSSLIQLALVLALYDTGEISEAIQQLTVTRNHVWQTGSAFFEYLYYLTEAHFAFAQKQDHVALEALRKALSWARQKDYASMAFFWRPGILSRLCSRALDAGIEVEYVQSFIRQLNLAPDPSYPVVENWPYPLKIITLGGFEIIRDGKALRFTGKTQQKPLAFLKSLIAFGCINVAEDAISDILWPEAEGDAAHKSFVMTLIRLRKLLGDDRAIIYSDGKVSIDLNRCFIDLALLEKAIRCAEEPIAQQLQESFPMEIISDSLQKCLPVISLYKGAFLPGEERFLLINQTRKRLSAKMVRLFAHVATLYEKCSEWPKVLESLEKALNVDNLSEEIYQRLMLCHHQMGQRSEAVRIYRQCEEILSAALGIKPSRKTMEIYQEILNS
jgi:DNA-binding SARP family transcriptional activator